MIEGANVGLTIFHRMIVESPRGAYRARSREIKTRAMPMRRFQLWAPTVRLILTSRHKRRQKGGGG